MTSLAQTEDQLIAFCDTIAPVEAAYVGRAMLAYCALLRDGKWMLYCARLRLDHGISRTASKFRSDRVIADRVPVSLDGRSIRQVIEGLLEEISADGVSVKFEPDNDKYSAYVVPLHRFAGERSALATLKIHGGRSWQTVDREDLGWHLRGAQQPFESLAEMCTEFDAGEEPGSIEVVAAPVVRILPNSRLERGRARVAIACAFGLDPKQCRISYRVIWGSGGVERRSIEGAQLKWDTTGEHPTAVHEFEVRDGSLIDCAVSYRGETNQQAWVMDRSSVGNPRRAAFEPSDSDLVEMKALLTSDGDKNARGFEAALAWLFWMLGFSPAHLCNSSQHEDGPDMLAECGGSFVVVECTIRQLKADKRSNLVARCVDIRDRLAASGSRDALVLPVLATRFTRDQAAPDLEEAARAGIHILTREDLALLMDRTRQGNHAAALLADWKHALDSSQAAIQRSATPIY